MRSNETRIHELHTLEKSFGIDVSGARNLSDEELNLWLDKTGEALAKNLQKELAEQREEMQLRDNDSSSYDPF